MTVAGAILSVAIMGGTDQTSAQAGGESGEALVVATKSLEPFVFIEGDGDEVELRGYSIDVWDELADRLDVTTEWVVKDSVAELLESTAAEDVDVAIAGISMTAEREKSVDFTHPYFDAGLQVAVRPGAGGSGPWRSIGGLVTSRAMLALAGGLLGLTLIVAHLVWWTERRENEEFPHGYREGIVEALWWSSVSVVTGGEAVKDIRRPLSRLLAVGWMIVGLFLIAFVTAQAASSLTLRELQSDIGGLDDLPGKAVVTVEETVAEEYLHDANQPTDTVATIDLALEQLVDGRYDAVVYDAPVLAYRVNTDYSGRVELAGGTFAPDPYGIALTTGSGLRESINAELLAMSRDGTLDAFHLRWFGVDR